jgi:hypothetical protein
MYYDDEARRFNFVSGLLFGGVLGAGLALLLSPQKQVRTPQRLRGGYRRGVTAASSGAERVRGGLSGPLAAAMAAARQVASATRLSS